MSLNVLTRIRPSAASGRTTTLSCLGLSCVAVWVAVAAYGASRTSPSTGAVVVVPELFRRFVPMIVTTTPAHPPHGVMNVMVGEQPLGFALVKSDGLLAIALALVTAPPNVGGRLSGVESIEARFDGGLPLLLGEGA
jgi:hypothetical protein